MAWVDGFERLLADRAGGSYIGAPWRLVTHSTEGDSIEGAVAAYRASGSWPTFTVDPVKRRKVQHYDTDISARALMHPAGTPETNRANAVQVEIVGYAAQMNDMPVDQLAWLANDVVAPIRAVVPFQLTAPLFVAYPQSYGAGAAQRMSWDEWNVFNGICGHEHVPGNDHGDPGALNITGVITSLNPPPPQPQEDEVPAPGVLVDANGDAFVFVRGTDGFLWFQKGHGQWAQVPGDGLPGDKKLTSGPSVSQHPHGVTVAMRGPDGATWVNTMYDGVWVGWDSYGGSS